MTDNFQQITKNRKSFTLIELLVVLALVAILSVVVILTLNPAELIKQARDSNRLSDLSTINTALNLFSADVTSGFMGTSTVVYVSIPDNASSTCGSLGLPTLPTGYTYNCVTAANLRNTNGTGWIPVNFQRISSNSPISQLPVDPQNTTSTKYYTYVTGGSWKVMATPESEKYMATAGTDGGTNIGQFEVGNNMNLAPFADRLVGWWKFDEGSGATTADSSGWGNTGTWHGTSTSWYSAGKTGSFAGYFNGSSDYVSYPDNPDNNPTSDFTYIAWVKPAASGGVLMHKGNFCGGTGYRITKWGTNVGFDYGTSPGYVQYTLDGDSPNGIWTNIALTKLGGVLTVYINGAITSTNTSAAQTIGVSVGAGAFGEGDPGCGYSTWYTGVMDEIRLYKRGLNAVEILALYNATK